MANFKQILSDSANKVTNRAKKIAQGVNNTISNIKSAVAKAARTKEILEEIVILKASLLTTNIEYKGQLNKLDNKFNTSTTGEYSLEDYILDKFDTEKYYNKLIETINKQISDLNEELNTNTQGFFGLKKTEAERLARLKSDKISETRNNTKNKLTIPIPKSFNDIVNTINTILSILFQFISVNNAKITETVDNVNNIISSAITKNEIETAKLLRNQALTLINTNKQSLQNVNKIISIIELIVQILNPIINALNFLPPLSITGATIQLLQKLQKILNDSSSLLSTANLITSKLLEDLIFQESRLLQINNILDINLENLTSSEISALINDARSGLGYLNGYDYKGFKFYIKEEEDPNFVVKGNKRRYAVALNKDGNEILKSQYSFTLEPDILVEELKLIIDEKNLVS
jgi:hypothetical protein